MLPIRFKSVVRRHSPAFNNCRSKVLRRLFSSLLLLAMAGLHHCWGQAFELTYQVSIPTGSFSDFAGKTSFTGFSWQGRKILKNNRVSVGGSVSWFYFVDKLGKTTVDLGESGTFTGNVNRYANILPVMAVVQYDLKPSASKTIPFIRAALGGAYQDQNTDIGMYIVENNGFQFATNAEAGVRISAGGNNNILVAATYHYLPKGGDIATTSFFGVKLGVAFSKLAFR